MVKLTTILTTVLASLISFSAYAGGWYGGYGGDGWGDGCRTGVPEIDGASAMLGLGLVTGIVALIREHRRQK